MPSEPKRKLAAIMFTDFYADKFLNAFPKLIDDFEDTPYLTGKKVSQNAYSLRTFRRFLKRSSLIDMPGEQTLGKQPLIDHLVEWRN